MYAVCGVKKSSPGKEVKTWRANAKKNQQNNSSILDEYFYL